MKMVQVGGEYYKQYEASDTYWMTDRWKRWLESDIDRSWQLVRWGIYTRDMALTWQIVALALITPWGIAAYIRIIAALAK